MSPVGPFGWFARGPKKKPPAHGLKMKKAGTTWWGKRWIEALEQVLRGDAGRLARGRTYARAGRAHDLVVQDGKVTAKVTGSRAKPYDIAIALAQLSEAQWAKAIGGMAQKAQFSAELLAGQMPEEIDAAFRDVGASLFPVTRKELVTSCSCPDWGDPCKHVAATHYVLGEALDRDPFLLFELRGKPKELVLQELRAARGGGAAKEAQAPRKRRTAKRAALEEETQAPREDEIPSVVFTEIDASSYDKARAPLPTLHFSFEARLLDSAVVRQLGALATWQGEAAPGELLAPLIRNAAESARRIAMAEARDERKTHLPTEPHAKGRQASGPVPSKDASAARRPAPTARRAAKRKARPTKR